MKHSSEPSHDSFVYRPDIDGLRAWAVMLVVLYHAGLPLLPGGFMGVDVFFVISGYLITEIIAGEVERGQFSIWRFYQRRIRRILPALAVMVLAVLAIGAVYILPISLERTSGSALPAMLFYANVHFWSISANYFAPGSETDLFLHTWSLAVEEQFYLIFPLAFLALVGFGRKTVATVMAVTTVASFVLMLIAYNIAPTATFFLPVTRAWEFLIGGLLALKLLAKPSRRLAGAGALVGLAAILSGALIFDGSMPFPGWVTLLPVLGAALVIHCGDAASPLAQRALSAEPIRRIGLVSYSLYLWHWPIFVLAEHHILARQLTTLEAALCVALSFAAAYLSWRFIEEPVRRAPLFRRPALMLASVVPLSATAVLAAAILVQTDGLSMRYPDFDRVSLMSQIDGERSALRASREDCLTRQIEGVEVLGCHLDARGNPNTLLWGDSFAMHYIGALADYTTPQRGRGLISVASPQCPPVIGYDPVNFRDCKKVNDQALAIIPELNVDMVLLSANWFSYDLVNRIDVGDIADTVRHLQAMGLRVIVIGQSPLFSFAAPEEAFYRQILRSGKVTGAARNEVPDTFNAQLQESVPADLFFNPSTVFCDRAMCRFYMDGKYLFRDYGHVTLVGAQNVIRELFENIDKAFADSTGR